MAGMTTRVSTQAQGAELIFLPLAIALAQLAAFAVEDGARQHVPGLSPVEC